MNIDKKYSEENVRSALDLIKGGVFNQLNDTNLTSDTVFVFGVSCYCVGLFNALVKENLMKYEEENIKKVKNIILTLRYTEMDSIKGFRIIASVYANDNSGTFDLALFDGNLYAKQPPQDKLSASISINKELGGNFDFTVLRTLKTVQDFLNENMEVFKSELIDSDVFYKDVLVSTPQKACNGSYIFSRFSTGRGLYLKIDASMNDLLISFDLLDVMKSAATKQSSKGIKL